MLEHKSNSVSETLKHAKIEEKLLWRAYRYSPTLFQTVPSPTPYGHLFPKIGGSQPHPKLQSLLSQERVKLLSDFKFGQYTHRIHPKQAHQNLWRKGSVGVSRDCQIWGYFLLSHERVKLRTLNFVGTFIGSVGTKAH